MYVKDLVIKVKKMEEDEEVDVNQNFKGKYAGLTLF
jgi:hypothetical protein